MKPLNPKINLSFYCLLIALCSLSLQTSLIYADVPMSHESWEDWVQSQVRESDLPVVQNRQVSKTNRFQIMAPLLGMSDRRDYYTNYMISGAGRYHFNEKHGWEFIRVNLGFPQATALHQEIKDKTDYRPDVQLSKLQISSSYLFSPIYGKYAWGGNSLIYFDIFATLGAGVRFADDRQPFAETGLGMNHYIFAQSFAVVPEYRLRVYSEKRTDSTVVFESMFQLGGSWLF